METQSLPILSHPAIRLFILSFLGLFLELMVIRWIPTQIRLIAYYANLMLISSFLGLGIGGMLAKRAWRLHRLFVPLLAALIVLAFAGQYTPVGGSDTEVRFNSQAHHVVGIILLVAVFILNTATFIPIGQQVGRLFETLPRLTAYSWDLAGSLIGTLLFASFSLTAFSPPIGFSVVLALNLLVTPRQWLKPALVLSCLTASLLFFTDDSRAIWSRYHHIVAQDAFGHVATGPEPRFHTRTDPLYYQVSINQDFYQYHGTIDRVRYSPNSRFQDFVDEMGSQYALPYTGRPGGDHVLVLGAGGGLDVEAALLAGAANVDAVDIDGALIDLSRRISPSDVYDSPKVHVHVDDARAYLQRTRDLYDVIVFGFLDSQRLFSYGSSLRQDGYVYTVESFRWAFSALKPDGVLSVSFSVSRPWVASKLEAMLTEATGLQPVNFTRNTVRALLVSRSFSKDQFPANVNGLKRTAFDHADIPLATDDWPYLYLRERSIPLDYLIAIGVLLALSAVTIWLIRPAGTFSRGDGRFFFLGAGFLLLQTRSITDCSLYFGTTWLVSLIVICGTLLMVLAANLLAMKLPKFHIGFYAPLFAALLLLALTPRQFILAQPMAMRLAWAMLFVPLPIFFAGLIFSTLFRATTNPSAAFAANLLGATLGGFCEYLSMVFGASALFYIVFAAYAASAIRRRTTEA